MKYRIIYITIIAGILIVGLGLTLSAIYTTQRSAVNITMSRYNTDRTGSNLQETTLNTTNVTPLQFGKLFSRPVIGDIYAQPLYVSAINIPGKGVHNVVYAATMHNDVYAFDADDPTQSAPLWHVNLGPSWLTTDLNDIWDAEVGVLSTPTIDMSTGTMYLINLMNTPDSSIPVYWIHAMDITTGQEKFGGPSAIRASVSGIGSGNVNGQIALDGSRQFQRTGLALVNGRVYAGFSSGIGAASSYHGWIISYTATDLTHPPVVWMDTPDGDQGGIWQGGVAPVIDAAGDLYFGTGNGTFDADSGGSNYADSFIHLHPTANGVTVADYFTPFNTDFINADDMDIATSGIVMLPGTNLLLAGEKHGQLYLVDAAAMGHHNAVDNHQIKQSFGAFNGWLMAPPVVWNSPQGMRIYLWSLDDHLREYAFANGQVQTAPVSKSTFANDGVRSPELTLSADGNKPGTAILWAVQSSSDKLGILRALDATDITRELWNSDMNDDQDRLGNLAKFNSPTVANGKVYVGTFSNQLVVYGLLPTPRQTIPTAAPLPPGNGTGLQAEYFGDETLSTLDLSRVDSTVNFNWGSGMPAPLVPANHFSARWTGQVQPLSTGYYTFSVNADDGARLWVDGTPLFDHWYPEGIATYSGTILLQRGQKYDLKLEYYQDAGNASVTLKWQGPGIPEAIIPQSQLYPEADDVDNTAVDISTPAFDAAEIESAVKNADASRGNALFAQYGCSACHNLPDGTGPYVQGLGQRASTRRPGYSAAAYIYESIIDPNAYVVPKYTANIMPSNFKTIIPDRDLYDLIAWLIKQ